MKSMNKNIRSLLALMLVLFACLGVYFFYAVSSYGGRWFSTPYNTRLTSAKEDVISGAILDRNGVCLARPGDNLGRDYPTSSTTRRALGHVIGDQAGAVPTGAETLFAAEMLGFKASISDRIAQLFSEKRHGSDVYLTVDSQLQTYIHEQFPEGKNGAVALYNYKTGEIYALYSKPLFDPRDPSAATSGQDTGALLNRATQGRYAPGSIFKIVTAACALENIPGVEERQFHCTGHFDVTDEVALSDTDGQGHGTIGFEQAFTKSCNIAFGQLALELGEEKLRKTAQRLGFDGNFLFPEVIVYESLFPKDMAHEGELAWTGVGQGKLMASPMHMAMIAGAVANDGIMVTPQLLLQTVDYSGGVHDSRAAGNFTRGLSGQTAKKLQALMVETVQSGTGTKADVSGYTVGGKTGTAQVNSSGGALAPHSWFVGYIQDESCPLAIAVIVENGGSGSSAAASLAGKTLKKAAKLLELN